MHASRPRMPWRNSLAMVLALSAATACDKPAVPRAPALGAAVPAFAAMNLEGQPVTLESLKGQVVVLNVWATWCRPCLEEIPQLEALHQTFGAQGVKVVGVSIDAAGMGADVRDFATAQNMHYTVWLDPDHDVQLKFLTMGVPETFVIDKQGVIRARTIGALRVGDTTLTSAVKRALGEPS